MVRPFLPSLIGPLWILLQKLDIHPLALEDVLHQRGSQSRSKADYYPSHLFVRILRHTLRSDNEDGQEVVARFITRQPRSASPDAMTVDDEDDGRSDKVEDWNVEEKTLAGSKFSTMRDGSMGKTNMDLEQGQQETIRGRRRRITPLKSVSKIRVDFP